jgi:vacuolar-type H+-ATPase subunit I/STV1
MADVDQAQATEQAQGTEALNADAVQKMISEAVANVQEQTKSEIAGLNRRNSELEKLLETTKAQAEQKVTETMTEAEKTQHEWQLKMEQITGDLVKANRAAELERNKNTARDKLKEAGLPDEFMGFIPLESAESIDKAVENATALFQKIKESTASEVSKKLGADTPAPPAADNPNAMERSAFEKMAPDKQMEFVMKGGTVYDS